MALRDTATLLRATYRSADIVARLGGDEFTVFPLEAGQETTPVLMRRLQDSLDRHNAELQRPFKLSLSVGVSAYDPAQCQTIEELLAEADRELYRRKRERF